jgi:hypothetical protein
MYPTKHPAINNRQQEKKRVSQKTQHTIGIFVVIIFENEQL